MKTKHGRGEKFTTMKDSSLVSLCPFACIYLFYPQSPLAKNGSLRYSFV